ncbi:MAG: hypothetical protein Q4A75_02890 [Peptostreptococcaceae bacterium]|nr:hypothetical protein [Peptostreptococcaceae bacterium]
MRDRRDEKIVVRKAGHEDLDAIIKFHKKLYAGDPYYRDNQTRTIKALFKRKMEIQKTSEIVPIVAEKGDEIVASAFLAVIDRMKDTVQIAFLEMEDDRSVAGSIIDHAKIFAKERGIAKILIGLDLHVNYGLGILSEGFDKIRSIGSSYNLSYYAKNLEPFASRVKELVSFRGEIGALDLKISPKLQERLAHFEIRHADLKNIEESAKTYSFINNQAFTEHDYYYESREKEDIELFKEYKLFLKPENILFAYKDGGPVAFVLWYPDFNQLIGPGQELGVKAFIKSRLFPKSIDTIKLTEFGVIPKYRRTGAIYALLKHCYELNKDRYRYIGSGWILSGNHASSNLTSKFLKEESARYKVFEIDI